LTRNRNRHRPEALFLHQHAIEELKDRLRMVNRSFSNVVIVTGFPDIWQTAFPTALIVPDDDVLDLVAQNCDLVIHAMSLHWANDMVGQLVQCRQALQPDGLFLAVCFGGQSLEQLRIVLSEAEIAVSGGLSPRVIPMAEIRDLGGLLQRAGLALPVADSARLTVRYQSPRHLMRELRAMGENNALLDRLRQPTVAAVMRRAEALYTATYGSNDDRRIPATFELIYLTAWAPDASQPKPLRPGSANTRLAQALKTREEPLID
jgi:hypothetical protein